MSSIGFVEVWILEGEILGVGFKVYNLNLVFLGIVDNRV